MKTGYTEAAGYCLLATAQRDFPNLGPAGPPGKPRPMAVVLNTTPLEARAHGAHTRLNLGYPASHTSPPFRHATPTSTPPA